MNKNNNIDVMKINNEYSDFTNLINALGSFFGVDLEKANNLEKEVEIDEMTCDSTCTCKNDECCKTPVLPPTDKCRKSLYDVIKEKTQHYDYLAKADEYIDDVTVYLSKLIENSIYNSNENIKYFSECRNASGKLTGIRMDWLISPVDDKEIYEKIDMFFKDDDNFDKKFYLQNNVSRCLKNLYDIDFVDCDCFGVETYINQTTTEHIGDYLKTYSNRKDEHIGWVNDKTNSLIKDEDVNTLYKDQTVYHILVIFNF